MPKSLSLQSTSSQFMNEGVFIYGITVHWGAGMKRMHGMYAWKAIATGRKPTGNGLGHCKAAYAAEAATRQQHMPGQLLAACTQSLSNKSTPLICAHLEPQNANDLTGSPCSVQARNKALQQVVASGSSGRPFSKH